MFLMPFTAFIAITSAAQLPSKNYLPQSQGPSSFNQGSNGLNQGSSGFSQGSSGFSQSSSSSSFQGSSQSFQSSQSTSFGGSSGSGDTGNRRPQQEEEKNAAVLKQDLEANENGDYHYAYETSNDIRAEEAGNTVESSGGFSYKGDDGITYTVTFTAGEGGFRPQGDHLPVPPPTPQEILEALEKNAKDEAAGIFDDGKYHPEDNANGKGQNGKGPGSSSSGSQFGTSNHQGTFNSNSGYSY